MPIDRVFVAGAGLMGHGIAQVHAAIGKHVVLYEPDLARAVAGRDRIAGNLDQVVEKRRLTGAERDAILERIEATDDARHAAGAGLVVEAIYEDLEVKRRFWREVDGLAPADAIFASNTSSIAIDDLAAAVEPDRRPAFVGMHFFSPVPVMRLVELVRGTATSDETAATIRDLSTELGKHVIVSADRPGFIVNRMLMPFLGEAMRAFEEGVGSAEDIDAGAKIGLNHPMGPLALADFIGLDVCKSIMIVLHEGIGGEQFRPPRVLLDLVEAGHLGQKTGRGFHRYDDEERLASADGLHRTHEPADRPIDALDVERLGEEGDVAADGEGAQLRVQHVAAHEHEATREPRVDRLDRLVEGDPAHADHPVVAQDRVGRIVPDDLERGRASGGERHLVAAAAQDAGEELADRRFVVDHEDAAGPRCRVWVWSRLSSSVLAGGGLSPPSTSTG